MRSAREGIGGILLKTRANTCQIWGQIAWRRCPREARGPCPGGVGPPSCPVRLVGPRTRAVASKLAQLSLAKRSRSWPGTRVGNPPDLSRTSPPRRAPKNRGRVGVESGRLAVKHQSANLTDGARGYSPNIPINSWRSARCKPRSVFDCFVTPLDRG